MPVPRRKVFNTLIDPSGRPLVGVTVTAKLLLPKPISAYNIEVIPLEQSTTTDANGYWELNLVPTDIFDDPFVFYWIEEAGHQHKITLPSGTQPVWIYSLIVPGDHDRYIIRDFLPMLVTSVRADDLAPLKGDIALREGTEISLEQDYNRKEITIHGRRVVGERGIIVSPREPYTRVVAPIYGVNIAPIAAQSSPGQTDQFARVDHTHEGVHALERLTGDISIDVTQGLRKVVDVPNKTIILKSIYAIYLTPQDFRREGTINEGFFMMEIPGTVEFTTSPTLPARVNSTNSLFVFPEFAPIFRIVFTVSEIFRSGYLRVALQDDYGELVSRFGSLRFYDYVNIQAVGDYELIWGASATLARIEMKGAPPRSEAPFDGVISRIALYPSLQASALYTGISTDYSGLTEDVPGVGFIMASCYLVGGSTYRLTSIWGQSDADGRGPAAIEGKLFSPQAGIIRFQPYYEFPTNQSVKRRIEVVSSAITAPATGWYNIIWKLVSDIRRGIPAGDPWFLGMFIEFL